MSAQFEIDRMTMEKAFYERDSSFDGLFFTGVKTTGIFCRPTCTARKPLRENLEFFKNTKEALDEGYRPCKVCSPMEVPGSVPSWIRTVLNAAGNSPSDRMRDAEIAGLGIDPARVRRWFKANHGMTFQSYLRALRIGGVFGKLKTGYAVIEAALDSGYESLSGFNDAFKKFFGAPPGKNGIDAVIKTSRVTTPLGPMLAGATEKGICLLEFVDRRMLETQISRISRSYSARFSPGVNGHLERLQRELDLYFDGVLTSFTVPLDSRGTEFQRLAWEALLEIPYGKTVSYKEQARRLGRPSSVRAVARANGDNRIAILIPCHRVVGHDGKLTGYGGGLWRKKYLLDLETRNSGFA